MVNTEIRLLEIGDMPSIAGLEVPSEFYTVVLKPAPLAGMKYPGELTPWETMKATGYDCLVCLTHDISKCKSSHLKVVYSAGLEDLIGGKQPSAPLREERFVRESVSAVHKMLMKGQGVVVHCEGGTGRTGTVIGCTLRKLGFESQEVIDYLDRLNKARGKPGWPESSWQADLIERYR
jgi:hypothetical protein